MQENTAASDFLHPTSHSSLNPNLATILLTILCIYLCQLYGSATTYYNVIVETQKLQELNLEAWTYLLRGDREMLDVTVMDVSSEKLSSHITRYLLTLEHHPEPIALIGKTTTAAEVHFYEEHANQLPDLISRCWFSQQMGKNGWLVLDAADEHHTPATWTIQDIEQITERLADIHSRYWDQELSLASLPDFIGRKDEDTPSNYSKQRKAMYRRKDTGRRAPASYFSLDLNLAGAQASALMKASVGLQILRGLGGWPGVLSEKHLDAFDDLLERPTLMLTPLQEMPFTLLHGRPTVENWRINLFDDVTLLDWKQAASGPSVCDLIHFIEDVYISCTSLNPEEKRSYYLYQEWSIVEETLIDSYFIRLAEQLDSDLYSARQMRRYALPAARCLYVLTHWLPTISEWFMHLPSSRNSWEKIQELGDQELASIGYTPLIGLRPHLKNVFGRFLDAYNLLWM